MCYLAFIESVLTFSFGGLVWKSESEERKRASRVVDVCSEIVGERQASLNELYESRAVRKGRKVSGDMS